MIAPCPNWDGMTARATAEAKLEPDGTRLNSRYVVEAA